MTWQGHHKPSFSGNVWLWKATQLLGDLPTGTCCEEATPWLFLGQGLCCSSHTPCTGEDAWQGDKKPSSAGTGGLGEEIICPAALWVPAELIHGMLRLCTFASTIAAGQRRLSLTNSVGIADTQSMAGFGKYDFRSCIIIRSFCCVTDFGPLIFLKETRTSWSQIRPEKQSSFVLKD